MKHKQILSAFVLVVLLASSSTWVARAHASDEGDKNEQNKSVLDTSAKNNNTENQDDGESEADKEDNKVKLDEENENHLNQNFDSAISEVTSTAVSLPEVSINDLKTYGDAIVVLQTYQKELQQLSAQADVSSTLGATVTDQERTLLMSLLKKHSTSFVQLNARIKEITAQMQTVIDLLQPMAQVEISPLLKKIVVGVVKDFKEEVKGLKDLEHQNYNVLDIETTL